MVLEYNVRTMNKKLTLKLDGAVIDRAKEYAETNHESVSGLVERFLKTLTETKKPGSSQMHSLVEELSGVITLPPGYDEREDYRNARSAR